MSEATRTSVSDMVLVGLVQEQLAEFCRERATFTAYAVTKMLRAANPTLEIVHEQVRQVVHRIMPQTADYSARTQDWNGTQAVTYSPDAPASQAQASQAFVQKVSATMTIGVDIQWDDTGDDTPDDDEDDDLDDDDFDEDEEDDDDYDFDDEDEDDDDFDDEDSDIDSDDEEEEPVTE